MCVIGLVVFLKKAESMKIGRGVNAPHAPPLSTSLRPHAQPQRVVTCFAHTRQADTTTLLVLCLGWNVRLIVSLPRRYGVMTLRYNRRTASQPSHVVRQNLQKGKLRVLNPAIIHVFYWFNWLNLIGS